MVPMHDPLPAGVDALVFLGAFFAVLAAIINRKTFVAWLIFADVPLSLDGFHGFLFCVVVSLLGNAMLGAYHFHRREFVAAWGYGLLSTHAGVVLVLLIG